MASLGCAFPKTQTGADPMLDTPAPLDAELLDELGLRVTKRGAAAEEN